MHMQSLVNTLKKAKLSPYPHHLMDKGHGSVLMFCSSPITAARCGVLLGVYCSAADSADTQCMTADYCRVSTVIYSRYGFVTEQ